MKKCVICGKEINGGFVVEEECLEKLKSDLEFSILETENKHGIDKLEAENARLKNDRKLFTEIHETVKSIGGKTRELSEENGQLLLENAELRARLDKAVELPCKVGDTIYAIAECENILMHYDNDWETGTGAKECPFENSCDFEHCADTNRRIFETEIANFYICEDNEISIGLVSLASDYTLSDFGKTIFLTRAEAEARLKELEEKKSV